MGKVEEYERLKKFMSSKPTPFIFEAAQHLGRSVRYTTLLLQQHRDIPRIAPSDFKTINVSTIRKRRLDALRRLSVFEHLPLYYISVELGCSRGQAIRLMESVGLEFDISKDQFCPHPPTLTKHELRVLLREDYYQSMEEFQEWCEHEDLNYKACLMAGMRLFKRSLDGKKED